jgi:hypothetical protein
MKHSKAQDQTELIWRWMHAREHSGAISELLDRAGDENWKPNMLGEEIMKLFYEQIPYIGKRSFWMDILDQCLERVDWTRLAKRALGKEAS